MTRNMYVRRALAAKMPDELVVRGDGVGERGTGAERKVLNVQTCVDEKHCPIRAIRVATLLILLKSPIHCRIEAASKPEGSSA